MWIIIIVVPLAVLGMVFYFNRKRWLAKRRTYTTELRQTANNDELSAE